jgi:transposase
MDRSTQKRFTELTGDVGCSTRKPQRYSTRVVEEYPGVPLLMSQPGVGAITALAFVLTLGDVHRFPRGKQVASYPD